jgi:hypothetical protein
MEIRIVLGVAFRLFAARARAASTLKNIDLIAWINPAKALKACFTIPNLTV